MVILALEEARQLKDVSAFQAALLRAEVDPPPNFPPRDGPFPRTGFEGVVPPPAPSQFARVNLRILRKAGTVAGGGVFDTSRARGILARWCFSPAAGGVCLPVAYQCGLMSPLALQRAFALCFVDGPTAELAQASLSSYPLTVRVFDRSRPQDPRTDSVVVAMVRGGVGEDDVGAAGAGGGGDGDEGIVAGDKDPVATDAGVITVGKGQGAESRTKENEEEDDDEEDWWESALALSHESCMAVLEPYLDAVGGKLRGVMERELYALLVVDPEWGRKEVVWNALDGFLGGANDEDET